MRLPKETYHTCTYLLLGYGIDPNQVAYWDTEAETSRSWNEPSIDLLEEVMHVGSQPILSLLLDHGEVANRRVLETMLTQVAGKGHLGIAKLLVENGRGGRVYVMANCTASITLD